MIKLKYTIISIFTSLIMACGSNRVMLRKISDNTPEEKNNVFARVDLYPDKPNKIMVFIWKKHDLFGVYRFRSSEEEIGTITPNSDHNADNILAEVWDNGSKIDDRYKVCIDKDMEKCIPINYYSADSIMVEKYK